ncbi:unnamed protein product [Rhodiola kirilowii]
MKLSMLKTVVALFALNFISFFIYLTFHPDFHLLRHEHRHAANQQSPTEPRRNFTQQAHTKHQVLKPWPILPSYLPWSQNPNVSFGSCEAFFGNGFTRRIDLFESGAKKSVNGGWFRCYYSETLRSSICEGGRVRMWPEKIKMSRGGEKLQEVIGRGEEVELPDFEAGAFDVDGGGGVRAWSRGRNSKLVGEDRLNEFVPQGQIMKHTMRELIGSIRVAGGNEFECDQWVEEPTILVTRFEYANLFHTITDWYSSYVASRVTGLPNRPHLVFVDGHCETQLEETWRALFSSLRYAKNFSGSVCFRHAIIVPLGYETPLFKGLTESIECEGASAQDLWKNPNEGKTARLSEFGEMIRAAFGFPVGRHHIKRSFSGHNVLFVRREDYLAHPRHDGKVESRLSNEQEVYDAIKAWLPENMHCPGNLINGLFAHMSMKEQLRAIQDASVIIGAHGAGLTHIVSAMPKTVILEIISSEYRRPHFQLIAHWKGLEYHSIELAGSYASPPEVIDRLHSILKSLGC